MTSDPLVDFSGGDGGQDAARTYGHPEPGQGRRRAGPGALIALIYDELRRVASRLMLRERAGHTLPPTAVVHEAVIRLLGEGVFDRAADRSFLFASAARAMREVLIDHARQRAAAGRGGGMRRVPLDSVVDYRTCSIVISVRSLSKSAAGTVFRNAVTQRLRGRRPFRSLSHYGNGTAPPRARCYQAPTECAWSNTSVRADRGECVAMAPVLAESGRF